ncbi:MAG: ABC transporter permease [Halanaeroarchaeum sp.]
MIGGGAWIAHDRAGEFPAAFRVAGVSLLLGAGTVIVTMTATGVIEPTVRNLLPVGSMIVANAMKTASLAFERFVGELENNREEIEAVLALGVPPTKAVDRYVERGVQASLIPVVDSLKSLGWVWIPGLMSGMVLAGENPIYAAEYQFVIMAMIFAAGGLTSLTSSFLIPEYAFTEAEQLRSFDGGESGADLG